MDHGKSFVVDQLPVVAADGRVMDLILRSDLVRQDLLPMSAVIMAGGSGTRLRPLTEDTPKPLLPIGDRPLMERMIGQLRQAGIRQVNVTTHYLSEKIIEHFGNGDAFGVELSYVTEDQPLGTAGSLAKLSKARAPLLVINGDILTRVDFRAMLAFHQLHQADMTVGVRQFDFQLPYGVVDSDGVNVLAIREKPVSSVMTNAGIYLLEPSVTERIPTDRRYDMTDLIEQLIAQGRSVIMFPIVEYWLDIGQMADYEQAQEDFRNGKLEL
jgi:NDP-sugar pyrophosphorylase family protein